MGVSNRTSRDAHTSDDDCERAIEDLADAVIQNLPHSPENSSDPFEIYAQRVRSKIYVDAGDFKSRCSRGYHLLVAELAKKFSAEN